MPYFQFQYRYFEGTVGPDAGGLESDFRVVWKTIHACICYKYVDRLMVILQLWCSALRHHQLCANSFPPSDLI